MRHPRLTAHLACWLWLLAFLLPAISRAGLPTASFDEARPSYSASFHSGAFAAFAARAPPYSA